ncbi:MarR family winged helix-turn-helix transcriptional regulator [Paenibacillus sp. GCM10023252]|uniref:MarR family winged helix-turn-helix transcriptional regulator n=1 Tax=Paenibacillus sp. GCM10023252 TaxID=3252649 RepID=UPI00360EED9C
MAEQPLLEGNPQAGEVLEILIRTTHHLHRRFEMNLASLGTPLQLTGPRLRVLLAVSEAGKIRMSDLASKIGIQARTVTQFVDALEQEELLVRLPDPDDRRATLLQVTSKAQPWMDQSRAIMDKAAEPLLAALPSEQQTQLMELLLKLTPPRDGQGDCCS